MSNIFNGSCLCKSIQFKHIGKFESFFLCHCKYCQKDTGSAHAANLFSTNSTLDWISGKELVKTFNLPNTRHVKSFCSNCGSAVPSIQNNGELIVVPAGCLDTPVEIKPNAHLFVGSKASWEKNLDKVQSFDKLPT